MNSKKMSKFEEKKVSNLSDLSLVSSEMKNVTGGIKVTVNWSGFFNGSLFRRGKIDEFDKVKNQ